MLPSSNFSAAAYLIADPARAAMLTMLVDGRARPAGELAHAAGVTAQTASSHLGKLLAGGLLTVETQGRHRYYKLSGAHVALALEHLVSLTPDRPVQQRPTSRAARDLQFARCCYDHLAGQLGVAVTQGLQDRGFIAPAPEKRFDVTTAGVKWFADMGVDVLALKPTRHGLARQCLDWTERTHHLAGPLGARFMICLCDVGWLRRSNQSRAVQLTPIGAAELKKQLYVTC